MALMAFREPNQVKWVGTRPAHRGTQIAQSTYTLNATNIIWTVSAGQTGFLATVILNIWGTVGTGKIQVRDAGDVVIYTLMLGCLITGAGAVMPAPATFSPPLEIPAGYDIIAESSAATLQMSSFVFGWEE